MTSVRWALLAVLLMVLPFIRDIVQPMIPFEETDWVQARVYTWLTLGAAAVGSVVVTLAARWDRWRSAFWLGVVGVVLCLVRALGYCWMITTETNIGAGFMFLASGALLVLCAVVLLVLTVRRWTASRRVSAAGQGR